MTTEKQLRYPVHGKVIINEAYAVFPVCNICLTPLIEVEVEK